jgi:hypothetical protein
LEIIKLKTRTNPKYPKNELYIDLSPSQKVALQILEEGLEVQNGRLSYSEEKGISWLSKLERDLEGEVSRATIDQCLDNLLDRGILSHGKEIMQKVKENKDSRWVRAYHIGNEFLDQMIKLYQATHDIKK